MTEQTASEVAAPAPELVLVTQTPVEPKRKERKVKRPTDDSYPTPHHATRALLSVERFAGGIWEPFAGPGEMAFVLREGGYTVAATTLLEGRHDPAFPKHRVIGGIDFLGETRLRHPNIVSNPPYRLTETMLRHALSLDPVKVCFLLNMHFLSAEKRRPLFDAYPPARVWVFRDRVTMYPQGYEGKKGSTPEQFAWMVWEAPFHRRAPQLGWITGKDFQQP